MSQYGIEELVVHKEWMKKDAEHVFIKPLLCLCQQCLSEVEAELL